MLVVKINLVILYLSIIYCIYRILLKKHKIRSMALQLQRAKTNWSSCSQMPVQGALWLVKCYPSTLISVLLTGFRYFSYQAATQLASRGWVDPVPDPILLEKFLGYSRESNPGPLGWQTKFVKKVKYSGRFLIRSTEKVQRRRHGAAWHDHTLAYCGGLIGPKD